MAVVDDLLNQLSSKFSNMSSELIGKSKLTALLTLIFTLINPLTQVVDEMSRRLDALEATIQAGSVQEGDGDK